jgi:hypothetical protein
MKCIALATCFSQEELNWHFPEQSYSPASFFAKKSLGHLRQELAEQITEFCSQLQSADFIHFKQGNSVIHIQKINADCCAVISDVELSQEQMRYLSLYLLCRKISLRDIGANLEHYTHDFKTQAIKADLAETLEIMKSNLDKTLERDTKLEDLLDKSARLEQASRRFEKTAKAASSSCWPLFSCTIL